MNRLDVYVTGDERAELKALVRMAQETPVIAVSSKHALEDGGFAGQAWTRVQKRIHEIALSHDLPEIKGYYGVDLEIGQVLEP